jgi:hypothetical protein
MSFQHETLALVPFRALGQTCDDLAACAHLTVIRKPSNLVYLPVLRTPILKKAKGLQRGRKLQTPTFRDKRGLRQERIPVCHDDDAGYRLRLWMRVL